AAARYALLRCVICSSPSAVVVGASAALPRPGAPCPGWSRPGVTPGPAGSALDGDAHRAGRALDDLHRGLDVVRVEVGELRLRDLAHLVAGDRGDLGGVRG